MQGQLTIGALIAFSAYQSRAFGPLQALMDLYLRIERAGVSLDRLFEFLDVGKDQVEHKGQGVQPANCRGAVEFREVTFFYDARMPVLQNVSFSASAGERLTILGPSGTGKTTVVDLLVRLYEPTTGTITLDGHKLPELDRAWLRNQVVVVSHDPFLFHASIEENLRYAKPTATRAEVVSAAKIVGLDDLVVMLPEGYETLVGERGTRLSAGQKQRIALARAVLKHPRVLVLDEALSGLDTGSEASLREALAVCMEGRTTITVTHRLSSLHVRLKLREWDREVRSAGAQAG
jgi:ATP-binding cassette subfamily B protein